MSERGATSSQRERPRSLPALERVRGWFLAPAGSAPARDAIEVGAPGASDAFARPAADPIVAAADAAVLGRAGDVEPVAAGLALLLCGATRIRAAIVAVAGAVPPEVVRGGGGGAARRLAGALAALGVDAHARGRLAWVALDPDAARFPAVIDRLAQAARRAVDACAGQASRRVADELTGIPRPAPVVLAVAAPRNDAIDAALAGCGRLVIVAEPESPVARLAAEGLRGTPAMVVPPLPRGLARAMARAGTRAPSSLRRALAHSGWGSGPR
jgi:hypothetical protein